MRRLAVSSLAILLTGAGLLALVAIKVGDGLASPSRSSPPPPPAHLAVRTVEIPSASGSKLAGWLAVPPDPVAAVVLLHGVRGDRSQMMARAVDLHAMGFAALLVDLQAHGQSPGEAITFGYRESRDAVAATEFLRGQFPGLKVGGIGVSLGGAAFALAAGHVGLDAVVLESVYPTIEEAATNRISLRLGSLSKLLAPLLLAQLEPRLGVSPSALRPVSTIATIDCPVLVAAGTEDPLTTETETRRLFEAARPPKALWLVPGAGHDDLHAFDPAGYRTRVFSFLERHLAPAPSVAGRLWTAARNGQGRRGDRGGSNPR